MAAVASSSRFHILLDPLYLSKGMSFMVFG
jgi:hypothetical protein